MAIVARFKSKQDLSAFLDFGNKVMQLNGKSIEYGYYDKPHYSGLNLATLAAIHEEGWGTVPMRNFMTSADILFSPELERLNRKLFRDILSGVNVDVALKNIAVKATKKIEFVIDRGLFNNPTVSKKTQQYRQRVGTNNPSNSALFHYGDLKNGAEWKIV